MTYPFTTPLRPKRGRVDAHPHITPAVVEGLRAQGLTIAAMARELNIADDTLRKRIARFAREAKGEADPRRARSVSKSVSSNSPSTYDPSYSRHLFAAFEEGTNGQTGRKSLVALEAGECHFPIDQPGGEVLFCALPVTHSHSHYCEAHRLLCERRYKGGTLLNYFSSYLLE